MKTRLLALAALLCACAHAAGVVTQSLDVLGATGNYALTFNWKADTDGTVPVTRAVLPPAQGLRITQVEVIPGAPAPTNMYNVQLLDSAGAADVMSNVMLGLNPAVPSFYGGLSTTPPIYGAFSLSVSQNFVAGAQGKVIIFFGLVQWINAASGQPGPQGPQGPIGPTGNDGGGVQIENYNFSPLTPGGSLGAGATNITMHPVPKGVNGTDVNHYLWVSGGTGTAEACRISGGGGLAGATTGTIQVTCGGAHSGAWTIASATNGIQEAIQDRETAGGGLISSSPASALLANASVYVAGSGITLKVCGAGINLANGASIVMSGSYNSLMGCGTTKFTATTTGGDVVKLAGCLSCLINGIYLDRSATPAVSGGNGFHIASGANTNLSVMNLIAWNHYKGIFVEVAPSLSSWAHINVRNSVSTGIEFDQDNDEHMVNVSSEANGGHGLQIGNDEATTACAGGFRLANYVGWNNQQDGIHIAGSSGGGGVPCAFVFIDNAHTDNDFGHALYLKNTWTGYLANSLINGGTGNVIVANVNGWNFSNDTFHNTRDAALHISGASSLHFANIDINDANSTAYIAGTSGTNYELLIDQGSNRITFEGVSITAPEFAAPGAVTLNDNTSWGIHINNADLGFLGFYTGTPLVIGTGVADSWIDAPFWTTITLANGWTASVTPQYRVERGIVRLHGTIQAGTVTDATTLFTLPAGYRPANPIAIPVVKLDVGGTPIGDAILAIDNAGVAKLYQGSSAGFLRIEGSFAQ